MKAEIIEHTINKYINMQEKKKITQSELDNFITKFYNNYDRVILKKLDLSGLVFENLDLGEAIIENCNLKGSKFDCCELWEATIRGCNTFGLTFVNTNLDTVCFINNKWN